MNNARGASQLKKDKKETQNMDVDHVVDMDVDPNVHLVGI